MTMLAETATASGKVASRAGGGERRVQLPIELFKLFSLQFRQHAPAPRWR
jgi:hypothetical protein